MSFNKLHIDCFDTTVGDTVSVRVRRVSDGLVLDSDNTFKKTPTSPLFALAAGTGMDASILSVDLPIDPSQFTDGDYRVYFHDMTSASQRVFYETEVSVFAGTDMGINPTANALRMFSVNCASHNIPGSYGQEWNDMYAKVVDMSNKLTTLYNWAAKQPGFSVEHKEVKKDEKK